MPTAGRSRGKLMGIGGLLAPDSEPAQWWLYPLARVARGRRGPRWIILRDALAVLAACRAKGPSPTAAAVMVARALNLHLKRRRLYAGRASAALAIRKSARALNLHLKVLRVAQV
jgi:hypothetical protein